MQTRCHLLESDVSSLQLVFTPRPLSAHTEHFLHTGDFRFTEEMLTSPFLAPFARTAQVVAADALEGHQTYWKQKYTNARILT